MAIEYRDTHPYWYYKRVELADRGASLPNQFILFDIKSGFDYWMKGLLISYPHFEHVALADDVAPPLYVAFIQNERNRTITEIPIPIELVSVPGGNQPPPPGHAQHGKPLYNGFIRFDYLISSSDVLKFIISGHAAGCPEYCRFCVVGHNVKVGIA